MRRLRTAIGAIAISAVAIFMTLSTVATANNTKHARTDGLLTGNVSLKVLAPKPYEVVKARYLALHVLAKGYKLDAYYAGTPVLPYIGHYHEILDGKLVDMTPLRGPTRDQISLVGVTRGKHVLTLVPALNNHMMIMSKAVNVPFYYDGPYRPQPAGYTGTGKPSIVITSPAAGSTVGGSSFTMTANVTNFVLSADSYAKSLVAGEGHWHIFVDKVAMSNMLTMAPTTTQTVPIRGVTHGWHTFYALLVNNQHMPVMPMTMASVRLFVR